MGVFEWLSSKKTPSAEGKGLPEKPDVEEQAAKEAEKKYESATPAEKSGEKKPDGYNPEPAPQKSPYEAGADLNPDGTLKK